jgi:Asp-tRNA(Asn)/Glu-tRNA(Gln) amidotransferase A subunit family amidase
MPDENCCVGLKPSPGLVSQFGCMGILKGTPLVYGPITRHVADVAVMMDALCGADEGDKETIGAPKLSFVASLDRQSLKGARVGVVRNLGTAIGMTPAPPEVNKAILEGYEEAIKSLKKAGAVCVDVEYSRLQEARDIFSGELFDNILAPEFAESFIEYFKTVDKYVSISLREERGRPLYAAAK